MRDDSPGGSIGRSLEPWLPSLELAFSSSRGASPRAGSGLGRGEIEAAGAALLGLQRGLTGSRELAGAAYMDDPELLGAYLLYYWPVSYLQAALALAELGLAPRRVLDLGSGPGPASAAALDAARARGSAAELCLADGSGRALELAARVLGPALGAPPRTMRLDLEAPLPREELAAGGGFDLILLGHCLNELWRGRADRIERRLGLLEAAAALLAPGGALLVIEPALLATSREAIELRDGLAARGRAILGPCPRIGRAYPCPALAAGPDRTCHAEAAWDPPEPVASLAAAAGLDRRSVKATWFALGAGPEPATPGGAGEGRGAPEEDDALCGRVVSDPMLNKAGRLRYFLCAGGRLATLSAPRDDPAARAAGFPSLRRGDFLRLAGTETRPGGGLGLVPGSRLEILGRAPQLAASPAGPGEGPARRGAGAGRRPGGPGPRPARRGGRP
ncbi:MAG TPA: small ribosomal subunit Rsm22 family protein [Spirochaetales bacterium]|nr:small ribosomal subunit Rsm22 family protein [Spirochaetales bacterium]HRY53286.1 small ribosomal subunit Rsm22 family protein [Spirochaetia bacterium]HRZ64471.1 small ribosomal subunit Rsm22 family protein [Spirochaetia bacterium]